MYLQNIVIVLSALSTLTSAHFKLTSPAPRGFHEDTLGHYPCGGFNKPSAQRTPFPLSGAPVQLFLEHTVTQFSVVLALGNNPSPADFTYVVVPTFQEFGPRDFCIHDVDISKALGNMAKANMNATMLVTSNGDTGEGSGLYNCADITLVESSTPQGFSGECMNSEGVRVETLSAQQSRLNPNGTAVGGGSGPGSSESSGNDGSGDHDDAATSLHVDVLTLSFAAAVAVSFSFLM